MTYTSLLTNYYSFVPFSYKLGLVRTLVDRIFKINNTRAGGCAIAFNTLNGDAAFITSEFYVQLNL